MRDAVKRFWKDEGGATAIEYAIIALMIAVPLIAILQTIGSELKTPFSKVSSALQ